MIYCRKNKQQLVLLYLIPILSFQTELLLKISDVKFNHIKQTVRWSSDDLIILMQSLQALCRAEDEEDIVAASQAKAEQVAELAEFNENIPLDDGGEQEEVEELSKAEQEIAALVEQVNYRVVL